MIIVMIIIIALKMFLIVRIMVIIIKNGKGHYDYRSFGIPGQTFMDEPETKGTLLNNYTSKNDEV